MTIPHPLVCISDWSVAMATALNADLVIITVILPHFRPHHLYRPLDANERGGLPTARLDARISAAAAAAAAAAVHLATALFTIHILLDKHMTTKYTINIFLMT